MKILTQVINDLIGTTQNIIINIAINSHEEFSTILQRKLQLLQGEEIVKNSTTLISFLDTDNSTLFIRDENDFSNFWNCEKSRKAIQVKIVPKKENNSNISQEASSIYSDKSDTDSIFRMYQKKKFVDSGAFGSVYKVKKGNDKFALKVIDADMSNPSYLNFILQEVFITSTLEHVNVVKTREVFFESNKLCIEMDWISKGNLYDRIKKKNISLASVVLILDQMIGVLQFLREKRMIHRDIKPNNIMVDRVIDNECLIVKLGDFGLARRKKFLKDHAFKLEGTMNYLSPEILERLFKEEEDSTPYTYASDMFALGVTIFQLLTFDCSISFPHFIKQSTPEKFHKWIDIQISSKCPNASPQFIELLLSMLQFNPLDRITSNAFFKILRERKDFIYSLDEKENQYILTQLDGKLFNELIGWKDVDIQIPDLSQIDLESLAREAIEEEEEDFEIDQDILDYLDEIVMPTFEKVTSYEHEQVETLRISNPIDVSYNFVEEEIIVVNGDDNIIILDRHDVNKRRLLDVVIENVQRIYFTLFENQSCLIIVTKHRMHLFNMEQGKQIWLTEFIQDKNYRALTLDSNKGRIFLLCRDMIHVYSLQNGRRLDDLEHPIFINFNAQTFDNVNNVFYIDRDDQIEIFTPGLQYISKFDDVMEKTIKIEVDPHANRLIDLDICLGIIDTKDVLQSTFEHGVKYSSFALDTQNRQVIAVNDKEISIFQY